MWLVPDCRMGVGHSEIVCDIIMGMGKFVGGAVGSPSLSADMSHVMLLSC